MSISTRAVGALGLGLVGVAALVGPTHGRGDDGVQKASNGSSAKKTIPAAIIGTIDIDKVVRDYEKQKFAFEQVKAEFLAIQGRLNQISAEGKQIMKEMETFQPGSPDFKQREGKVTQLKARLAAEQEQAERDIAMKEGEALATTYKEIQAMVARVAYDRGMNYVVRVSNEPPSAAGDPRMVLGALARPIVYSDPSSDITKVVIYNLNLEYERARGTTAPKAAISSPATAPAAGGALKSGARTTPRGN